MGTVLIAVGAFALRIAYFVGALAAVRCAFARKRAAACVYALGANVILALSGALGDASAERLPALGLLLLAQTLGVVFSELLVRSGEREGALVMPYVALLSFAGVCVLFDVYAALGADAAALALRVAFIASAGCVLLPLAGLAVRMRVSLFSGHALRYFAASVLLLALPLVAGVEMGGATSWLSVAGGSLQTSEFAKVTLVIASAGFLAGNATRLSRFSPRGFVPIGAVFLISLGMVALQRDLGCALVLFLVLAVMLANSAKNGWVYLLVLAAAGVVLAIIAYYGFDHVRQRFDVWLDPLSDPDGLGYQYRIAMSCLINGGIVGCGLGNGLRFENLPVAESDYIYPVLCEELGLLGCLVVLTCYAGIAVESARCASALPRSSFERNLVAAAGMLVSVEALLIVAGTLNLIPLTGIVLPLVSRGGSSFLATCAVLGLMLGASCSVKSTLVRDVVSGCERLGCAEPSDAPRGRIYGAEAPMVPRGAGGGIRALLDITAPRVMAAGVCLALAVCLGATVCAQVQAGAFPRLCGETAHENVRGSILTSDGVVLARDEVVAAPAPDAVEADGGLEDEHPEMMNMRVYPEGTLASHVVGALSDGIEARIDLTGSSALADLLTLPERGDDVVLTIDSRIQRAAEQLLEGKTGALVAIDPQTGRILAAASSPAYNLEEGVASEGQSYLNRAFSGLYSPGSTFKLVTLAAALENGTVSEKSVVSAPATEAYVESRVVNFEELAYGELSLTDAMNLSVNTAFARIGSELGAEKLVATAEALGFNDEVGLEVGFLASSIGNVDDSLALAWAACGEPQGDAVLAVTPLQMALVMCAVCNDGVVMRPYVVEGRLNERGRLVERTESEAYGAAFSAETARTICSILAQNEAEQAWCPYPLIGKTGTAQNEGVADNAWYVCAGERDGKQVVVACVIEQGGIGAYAALPCATSLVTTALDVADEW